jgi:hypothetical protein
VRALRTIKIFLIFTVVLFVVAIQSGQAVTLTTSTIDDGYAYWGGNVSTAGNYIFLYSSGSQAKSYPIFEFDLSSIPDGATILGADLTLIYTYFNLPASWGPGILNYYAYTGDGAVTASDFTTPGTLIASRTFGAGTTIPQGSSENTLFGDVTPIQNVLTDSLTADYLTIRVECATDYFYADYNSIEQTLYAPATLKVSYNSPVGPSPVPEPGTLLLLGLGLLGLFGIKRQDDSERAK